MVKRAIRLIVGLLFIFVWQSVFFVSIAAAEEAKPLIKRLDDATRAKVLAALAGLIILGFAMVLLTWLGARITQRYRQSSSVLKPTPRPGEHEWSRKSISEDDS
jgi:hypothetical protein